MATKVDRLSKSDIIAIIKACHKNNVSEIDIEGLKINFSHTENVVAEEPYYIPPEEKRANDSLSREADRQETEEDMISQLLIEDPEAWDEAEAERVIE